MVTTFIDTETAFNDAIASGLLVTDAMSEYYVGDYMYMGTDEKAGLHKFKHIMTRAYLTVDNKMTGVR